MFLKTLMLLKTTRSSETQTQCCAAAPDVIDARCPRIKMSPSVGTSSPAIIRNTVVLPPPLDRAGRQLAVVDGEIDIVDGGDFAEFFFRDIFSSMLIQIWIAR